MEIIHADENLIELQMLTEFEQYEAVSGLGFKYADNDFELQVKEAAWEKIPMQSGHYLYEVGTEWGGMLEDVNHVGTTVKVGGPTWRGMLARKIISPPSGQAYRTITTMEANQAIAALVGSSLGSLFTVSTANSGITVSGSFRYTNLLAAIHSMLQQYGARLEIIFDGTQVVLSVVSSVDYTETELSQDYDAPLESSVAHGKAYNHVIALGRGELVDREVVELWRLDDGTITTMPQPVGPKDKQFVLDYPNAESAEELANNATVKLIENAPEESIAINLDEIETDFKLGDVVGGKDNVTGLKISKPITQKILKIDKSGRKINYKAGE
nr:hypothetical protein [uncultured Trichococcus sp.]